MRILAQLKPEQECEISRVHRWHTFCHHSLLVKHTHTQIHRHVQVHMKTDTHIRLDPWQRTTHIVRGQNAVSGTTVIAACGHLSVKKSVLHAWWSTVMDSYQPE